MNVNAISSNPPVYKNVSYRVDLDAQPTTSDAFQRQTTVQNRLDWATDELKYLHKCDNNPYADVDQRPGFFRSVSEVNSDLQPPDPGGTGASGAPLPAPEPVTTTQTMIGTYDPAIQSHMGILADSPPDGSAHISVGYADNSFFASLNQVDDCTHGPNPSPGTLTPTAPSTTRIGDLHEEFQVDEKTRETIDIKRVAGTNQYDYSDSYLIAK